MTSGCPEQQTASRSRSSASTPCRDAFACVATGERIGLGHSAGTDQDERTFDETKLLRGEEPHGGTPRRRTRSASATWSDPVRHVVSPLDRWLYQATSGRRVAIGKPLGPLLLLTTTGRRTGVERTTPVFYLRDGERLVVCNVNPGFERPNPWTLNLRANPTAQVQIGKVRGFYQAREASQAEIERYWPHLVAVWPAYQTFYDRSGQRLVFVLEPREGSHPATSG